MININYLFKDVCKNNQHNTLIFFGAKNRSVKLLLRLNVLAAIFLRISFAQASGPVGGVVQTGTATITSSQNGQSTTIVQTTPKTSINWNQFSIDQGSRVTFIQPNAASIALNRVTGNMPSQISGQLLANGQVWILNPNGVLINRTGEINTASFLATTNALSDQNFQSGNYQFTFGGVANSYVSNYGSIIFADGGYAVLSGNAIRNNGLIQANLGSVVLAGAQSMTVDLLGNRLISFAINDAVTQTPEDGLALINNSGKASANGGQVLLTARSAIDMLHQVINTQGVVEAKTAKNINGQIVLDAGPRGEINIEGVVDASGVHANETGGSIKVFGNQITVNNNALLNASGDVGGGTIWVGGGPYGTGVGIGTSYMPALSTYLARSSVLNASAITNGNGGTIAVWSDITNPLSTTKAFGSILATGGELGGNGGWVETSGYHLMTNNIYVNTFAKKGITGMWLIDPADYTILEEGGDMSGSQLSANLGLSSLTIRSTTGLGGENGDIYVYDSITWNANTTLTLTAVRDININQSITAFGQNAGLILNPGSSGVVRMTAGLNNSTSSIVMNGPNSILNINGTLNVQPHDANHVTATLTSLSSNRITVGGLTADTIGPSLGTLNLTGNLEISGTSNQTMSANVALQNFRVNASTLVFNNPTAPINVSGVISGQGNITVSSGSQVRLSNLNSYSGETRISGGTLELIDSGSLGSGDVVMSTDMINYPRLKTNSDITFPNNFVLNADSTFLIGEYTTATISGVISGVGGLNFNSSVNFNGDDNSKPALVLTNQNTYTGATVIYPYVAFKLEGNGSISNSEYIYNAGAFHISGITGSETSIKNLYGNGAYLGDKNLIFTEAGNDITYGGGVNGNNGYLTGVFTGTDKSRITVSGGTLTMTAPNYDFFGTTTINTGATLALSGSGTIAASSLVNSNGTFDISATDGGVQINSLSGSGNVNLGANTLIITNANNDNFSGVIADGGINNQLGGGVVLDGGQQTFSGVNTYTGATSIYYATLALSGSGSISNSSEINNYGSFDISNTSAGATVNSLGGSGVVYLGSQILSVNGNPYGSEFNGVIADGGININQVGGGLTILSGTQYLKGINTYTGSTEIRNGATLVLGQIINEQMEVAVGSIATSSGLRNNGTFDISDAISEISITSLSGSGNVNLGANTLTITNANNDNFSGVIADGGLNGGVEGSVALQSGQQRFSGANTYTGATILNGGTLYLASDFGLSANIDVPEYGNVANIIGNPGEQANNQNAITVNREATLDLVNITLSRDLILNGGTVSDATSTIAGSVTLTANSTFSSVAGDTLIVAGVISDGNSGFGIIKTGSGNLNLAANNTYTGATTISQGILALTGTGSISSSSGVTNNANFDISATNSNVTINILAGSGTTNLGSQNLNMINSPNSYSGAYTGSGGISINGGPITYPNAQQPVVIAPVVVQPVVVTPVVEQNPTVIAQVVINQVVTPDSVTTPAASPVVGTETVSNNSDPVSVSGSSTTPTTTTASTPSSPVGGTSTAATPTTNTSGGTSTATIASPTTTETQTQPVSMANTTIGAVNAPPPATAATTATGPTIAAVAPVAAIPAQTPPVIVSKPVPKDNADTGDSTLASVKPPATTTESPKQPARNDVRVTSTTVTAGVTIQKVEPIKPSSTEYYNQVISGLWNPK